ncbi:MAG: hypothetical protein QW677_04540 [Pyrobaculum sp.]|uniref:Uncharacterized protein n=1 Tax=Pyrobaculum oguniense (strain DSM 13380 / JCM 10595 / TE7) TaxID=698757 RepID=H6QDI4_PYROT|nr:hypothetical protein Pogu_2647 [Pyrobaculum oguniense TE7]
MAEEVTSQRNSERNYEDLIKRREAIQCIASAGLLALSINPILAMAFAPRDVSGAQPVDRVVVDFMEKEKWKDDSTDVYYIKMQVTTNQQKSTVIGFVVRDVASDFLPPLIVIGEGEKDANILAFSFSTYLQV